MCHIPSDHCEVALFQSYLASFRVSKFLGCSGSTIFPSIDKAARWILAVAFDVRFLKADIDDKPFTYFQVMTQVLSRLGFQLLIVAHYHLPGKVFDRFLVRKV
jgi:hypothetical protein